MSAYFKRSAKLRQTPESTGSDASLTDPVGQNPKGIISQPVNTTLIDTESKKMTMHVSALHYYPIKSCGGIAVKAAALVETGFKFDRLLMLVDEQGQFITQREYPRMALIQPRRVGQTLSLVAPTMKPITIELTQNGNRSAVVVWRSTCEAIDQGETIASWFSDYLGTACRLVLMADDFARLVNPDYARTPQDAVSFADGYPFLLISEASLADLNSRLADPLPMNRFRPNIVITGCEPFAEDNWQVIRIGPVDFKVAKPCARCVIITTNQETAETSKEPLRTLATYRNLPGQGVMFGQNLIHHHLGTIRVGDAVTVIN